MKKYKKSKKKLAFGAYLQENQAPLSAGATLAGQTIRGLGSETNEGTSIAGGALSGAGTGASIGSVIPGVGTAIGAGVGAVVGGISGGLQAKKAQQAEKERVAKVNALTTQGLMNNAGAALAEGGYIANKLGVIQGGSLNSISPDAVEVKANNPSKTDSVELQDAYVDHNEVIDNKNRVFSDELGFAKYAKKLEKQKNDHPRFSAANSHIDNKLDNLFQVQEQTKEGMKQGAKTKKAKGGYLTLTGPFPMSKLKGQGPVKYNFDEGGELKLPPYIGKINQNLYRGDNGEATTNAEEPKGGKLDFTKGLNSLATFAPNLVSATAQSRLQGPASPQLEHNVSLQRVNPNAQIAEAENDANSANQVIRNNTAQGSNIASAAGNILAKRLANKNAIYGQNQQINAGIQAQEAGLNSQIGARNTERTNAYTQGQADFSNLKQRLTSENVANLSGKVLQQGRENNQMQLDKDKAAYTSLGFKESGVLDRGLNTIKEQDPEQYKRFKSQGFARGGNLSNRPIYDSGPLQGILGLYSHPEPHNAFKFENNEAQNLQSHKEKSKHGKSSHKLAKGGYMGGGETPNDPKKQQQAKLQPNDFKQQWWRQAAPGVTDTVGRPLYAATNLNIARLNRGPVAAGLDPNAVGTIQEGDLANKITQANRTSAPLKTYPAYNIAGSVAPQAGSLAHFLKGGSIPAMEGLGDPRHIEQASSAGQDKAFLSKGGIHINPKNKGKFNALKKRTGESTEELKHSKNPLTRKRATFAANAKNKFHHKTGGMLENC